MAIRDYIDHPELLTTQTIDEVKQMLQRYPYCQTLRLLLLRNLYQTHHPDFDHALRRNAILVADRRMVFSLIEGANYQLPQEHTPKPQPAVETDGDRMLTLIDSFLSTVSTPRRKAGTVDPSQDYAAYLEQMAEESEPRKYEKSTPPRHELHHDQPAPEAPRQGTEMAGEKDFFTETLAQIYIKQKKYERALEIIKALESDNSKKSSYFADQIRFLEKIIEINKQKRIK